MDEESLRLWLEDEKGQETEYELVGTFAVEEKEYMALHPMEGTEGEVVLTGFRQGENDSILFEPIADDEEYRRISEIFLQLFQGGMPQEEYDLFQDAEEEQKTYDEYDEDEYCYQDREGRLFLLGENGEVIYLDEFGNPAEGMETEREDGSYE